MNTQVAHWKQNSNYQAFLRQVHVDIYVALKNGVPAETCKQALRELGTEIEKSVDWTPVKKKTAFVVLKQVADIEIFVNLHHSRIVAEAEAASMQKQVDNPKYYYFVREVTY